ncbi:MAG: hypothetical protein WC449_03015 [Candidatus Paceibacterota bacterium]
MESISDALTSWLPLIIIAAIIAIILYIIVSFWFYTMARKVGVGKNLAWLAFVPIGRQWILGKISTKKHMQIIYPLVSVAQAVVAIIAILAVTSKSGALPQMTTVFESYRIILYVGNWIAGIIGMITFYGVAERFGRTDLATPYIILGILSLPWISTIAATIVASVVGLILTVYVAIAVVLIGYIALMVWNLSSIYRLSQSEVVV